MLFLLGCVKCIFSPYALRSTCSKLLFMPVCSLSCYIYRPTPTTGSAVSLFPDGIIKSEIKKYYSPTTRRLHRPLLRRHPLQQRRREDLFGQGRRDHAKQAVQVCSKLWTEKDFVYTKTFFLYRFCPVFDSEASASSTGRWVAFKKEWCCRVLFLKFMFFWVVHAIMSTFV